MNRRAWIVALLAVLMLAAVASADIFRGRFRVGSYTTVPQGGQMSWAQRAAQPGLRMVVEMASLSDIQTGGTIGSGVPDLKWPAKISYDAAKNAMRISVTTDWGESAPQWRKAMDWADSFTDGDTMWVQFDVFYDAGMLTPSIGGGGIKQMSIDSGRQSTGEDSGSCNNGGTYPMDGQLVMHLQHISNTILEMYHACEHYIGLDDLLPFGDVWFQNKYPDCKYHTTNLNGDSGCFRFLPNVWHTITIHIKIGTTSSNYPPGVPDSQVDIWGSYTGQTAASYIHSKKNLGLRNLSPGQGRFGQIFLFPYDTGRTSSTVDGNVWYRRLLFGSQPLKDPTSGLVLVPDGAAPPGDPYPSTLVASYLGVTGQDKAGQGQTIAPNGTNDFHVSVTGLRGTPTRIRINNQGTGQAGTWEYPANGINWMVAAEYGGGGANTGDFWFEPWQESLTHVKVWYADGSTDEADATTPGGPSTHTLTVSKVGTGTVTSSVPSGAISCGGDCAETIANGTAFTMSATPGTNYIFSGWQGGGCSGTGACSLTLNANTTVTATFASTQTPGNLASIPDNGWLAITPNLSSRYVVTGLFDCAGQVLVSDAPESGAFGGYSSPMNKGFTGIAVGGGKILYWGGGHGHSGSSAEVYDPLANRWTESFKPEVCANICTPGCGMIYGGSSPQIAAPSGRPYGEQAYDYNVYIPTTGKWRLQTRGPGPYTYDDVAQTMIRVPLTMRSDGITFPWGGGVGNHSAFWAPDISDLVVLVTTGGVPAGLWRQNDTSTTPPKWQLVGPMPNRAPGLVHLGGFPLSTYVTSQHKHLFTIAGENGTATNQRCEHERFHYWLDPTTMTWSDRIVMPAGDLSSVTQIDYDSIHDKLVALRDCVTPIQMWVATPAATPVWTPLPITAAVTSNQNQKILDIMTTNPSMRFDAVNNVFWYVHSAHETAIELWAYRLQN